MNTNYDSSSYETNGSWYSKSRPTQRPTNEFLGWRHLHLSENVRIQEGARLIVIIPSDICSDPKAPKNTRGNFHGWVVGSVPQSCQAQL